MKQIMHKSMAVLMAAVVLMTTMSFTVDMHYCGDSLVDFSFVQKAKSCGMENAQATTSCERPSPTEKSCCSDKQVVKEGNDDLKISLDQLTLAQQVFVVSFTYAYSSLFEGTQSEETPFLDNSPPFIRRDLQVLHQTFLI